MIFFIKLLRYISFSFYKKKIKNLIKDSDISDFLLKSEENYYLSNLEFSENSDYYSSVFEGNYTRKENNNFYFGEKVPYHYLYFMIFQIFNLKKIDSYKLIYKNFFIKVPKSFLLWLGKDIFITNYILNKIYFNLKKGFSKKPEGVCYEKWLIILNKISIYLDFYLINNYNYYLKYMLSNEDIYKKYKYDIEEGYRYLKKYWRFFDE